MSRPKIIFFQDMDIYANNEVLYHKDDDCPEENSQLKALQDFFLANIELYMLVLTDRQSQVLRLFLSGKSFKKIGIIVGIDKAMAYRHYKVAVNKFRNIFNSMC